jgi:hypothetical protein
MPADGPGFQRYSSGGERIVRLTSAASTNYWRDLPAGVEPIGKSGDAGTL